MGSGDGQRLFEDGFEVDRGGLQLCPAIAGGGVEVDVWAELSGHQSLAPKASAEVGDEESRLGEFERYGG